MGDHSPVKPSKMNKSVVTILIILVVTTSSSASPFRYRSHKNHVIQDDYDDFSEVPKFLRYVYNLPDTVKDEALEDILLPSPKKRYLGIDIPDYISSRGKSDSIRPVIDKMRELVGIDIPDYISSSGNSEALKPVIA